MNLVIQEVKIVRQINIKEYFNQEMQRLRNSRLDAPSLMIVDATSGDAANQIYIRNKMKDFEALDWKCEVRKAATTEELKSALNAAEAEGWSSIIVQMPVAAGIEFDYSWIPPYMDADGLAPASKVMPATVRGIIDYLDACGFEYESKTAVVLGRSDIVGKPMAKALMERNMTVSICHSKTHEQDKMYLLRNADLVICATGQSQSVYRAQCPDAIVVDVGISRVDGKIVGDFVECEESKASETSFATPVPGGVGLLTRLGLMKNCLELANGRVC